MLKYSAQTHTHTNAHICAVSNKFALHFSLVSFFFKRKNILFLTNLAAKAKQKTEDSLDVM